MCYKKFLQLVFLCLTLSQLCFGQNQIEYIDKIYEPFIKTAKLNHDGLSLTLPILDLNSSGRLTLSFDDIDGGIRDYSYQFIHCDQDWTPSDLDEQEFLDGFNNELIEEYYVSQNTKLDYTNYSFSFPNLDVDFLVSGNYVLAIYDEDDDHNLVLTKRFLVSESQLSANMQTISTSSIQKRREYQEVELELILKNFEVQSPMQTIKVDLLQNGRWDNMKSGIIPRNANNQRITFNFFDSLTFLGLKEYRFVDLRTIQSTGDNVRHIDVYRDSIDVLLELGQPRSKKTYSDYQDINGAYVNHTEATRNIENVFYASLSARMQYVNAIFSLEMSPLLDKDVYVVGRFNDYMLNEENRMYYDHQHGIYLTSIMLKQGYYDYMFATSDGTVLDIDAIEGSSFKTENDYKALVYYRPFGNRYDRLIAIVSTNSRD